MFVQQSDVNVILVALPMVGVMFATIFRVDELLSRPKKRSTNPLHAFSHFGKDGSLVCVEPDGEVFVAKKGR